MFAESDALAERCRKLTEYTRDMYKAVSEDLDKLHRAEDKKKYDLIKDARIIIGTPGALVTLVKNGVGDGGITVGQAAGAGIVIGSSIVFHKRLIKAFEAAGNELVKPNDTKKLVKAVFHSDLVTNYRIGIRMAADDCANTINFAARKIRPTSQRIQARISSRGPRS